MNGNRIPRIGVRGPVGSGKTMLTERVVPILATKGYNIGIVSNDVVSREDADKMRRNLVLEQQLLQQELVIGLATGGCPHTAVREDPSV
jgi:urease accessory protein